MNRRSVFFVCLCMTLALMLCACGQGASSSRDPYAVFDEPVSSSSASSSETPPAVSSAPESAGSESEEPATQLCFVSLPLSLADGSTGRQGLIVLDVPKAWNFDNYITLSRDDVKIAEIPGLWEAPVSDSMTAPYKDNSFYPEGFGYFSSEDIERGGRAMHLLHLKILVDGSETPSYMHCIFCEADGYVIEAHVYTAEESGGDTLEALLTSLETAEVHFSTEE